jgi:hypothetical protein
MEPFHAGGVLPKPPQFKIVGSCTIVFIEYSEMGITNRCSCPPERKYVTGQLVEKNKKVG